ncbi:16S rRNA (uracil(1498)-N(3))-methyltransferase [Methyloceanibacter sp.]|uniref:16S rRNA (uracil(1498)-N(3))-methyltransferase n=1 Tax=Methyloceanibacter sp. TaxID=1965321 RepID=UPI002B6B8498|nr:16S rRNA (uracil(1498)-N(3))-methyltransferase [Methyloceanibacter sp.]HML90968.1 16S rRNA (uracil(1498)-N(3))-methyltransferase [Methyloceanibacter sp.]
MPSKLPRLFVKSPLSSDAGIVLDRDRAHYLANVLRLRAGAQVLLFNGVDGEWRARVTAIGKRDMSLVVEDQTRPQETGPDLHYLFAPIKRARVDYMAQKATEMGASLLRPVITRRTIAERVKVERLEANAVEAAEQCGILRVPEVRAPQALEDVLASWDAERLLIFADESAAVTSPLEVLAPHAGSPHAVLIGPEGGFDPEERDMLLRRDFVVPVSLGPRVMRADTAAVACLALVNAVCGDWR